MTYVSARAPSPKLVIYTADDGSETVREGGSRAWRNNNQGNIQKGSFADAQGAIGADSRFAIFPSESAGAGCCRRASEEPGLRRSHLGTSYQSVCPAERKQYGGICDVRQQCDRGRPLDGSLDFELEPAALDRSRHKEDRGMDCRKGISKQALRSAERTRRTAVIRRRFVRRLDECRLRRGCPAAK